ncbi:o-succinylbenzoate--CoA ligase [Lactovum miscens]|uniref:O-succinylbenzoic acid--CoA ligase n=1 Tax=Lactovum miscens TaxID=190387 RepID=A0A841C005_9LACT|nr:o-succinylbenzoate--CoA ligase [Lactovum miscens]MBB5887216.1 O-succinylbenzoic acid--CoA ligase [Lactovum miscens]
MLEYLKKWAETQPEKFFINDLTFRKVLIEAVNRSNYLVSISDERVALLMNNNEESLLTLLGLLLLSKEVLLLNPALTQREISDQTEGLKINVVIQPKTLFSDFTLKTKISSKLTFETNNQKIAVLMNTSATSGKFKTVPITWGMIEAQCRASAKVFGVNPNDNWLDVLPLFHVSGLSIVMRSLYNGTQLTLTDYAEDVVIDLVKSEKLTMMSLVPTQLKPLVDHLKPYNLRMILLGGETIPLSLVEKAISKGLPVYKTYGMTETFSQSVTFNVIKEPQKIATVGHALPDVTIEIEHPDKQGIGEIWIKSPMLMKGYLGQIPLENGFATGDLGYLDEDNYLYVLNRRRDIIISGGENIYPKEIEDLLYRLPEIFECALVPRDDPKWGQIPILYYVGELNEIDIRNYLSDKLAKFKQPKIFIQLEELPKNPSGKILRKDLN